MYLLTQVWWYLLLAFVLGVLIGYWIWRLCSRPMLEARLELSRKDMADRLEMLENERARFASAALPGNAKEIHPDI